MAGAASDRSTASTGRSLTAGIVAFFPDGGHLLALVDAVAPDVDHVVVFMNSDIDPVLRAALADRPQVALIEATRNLGIGVALNLIALRALWDGSRSVVYFDQDSDPAPGTIPRLLAAQEDLVALGHHPAVVAPMMVVVPGTDSKPPTYRFRAVTADGGRYRSVTFVPTSGSLIRLSVIREIGPFRADYFIDGIDLEWSFRAWSAGHSCWIVPACPMNHTVGSGTIAVRFLGLRMPKQRPFRMYCTIRNTVYGLRLRHVPCRWKLKQLAYLPVQMLAFAMHHRFRLPIVWLLVSGVIDGLLGRLGIPRDAPDGRAGRPST